MTINTFFNAWNGRYNNYDGWYGNQCVDLMRQFVKDVYQVDPYTAIPTRGNAADIFRNFRENKYFKKVLNDPDNVPQRGDIIFWGYYPLLYSTVGHVAVFDQGDVYTIISFDQNWPTNTPCHFQRHGSSKFFHGYRGCLGWLHKK